MTNEAAITSGNTDASSSASTSTTTTVADTSAASGNAPAPSGAPAGGATAGAVQQGTASQATAEDDPLSGVPSIEEINQLPDDARFKKSLIQMREAIDGRFKPQLAELTEKYKAAEPFVSHLERFQSPDDLQNLVNLQESLYGYERDQSNGLVPSTEKFAQELAAKDLTRADFLTADLLNMETKDPQTGLMVPRINLALQGIAEDPARRALALQILGGVEPTSIAPTWLPTQEQLNLIDDPDAPTPEGKALQAIFGKLPYDEREKLAATGDPDFIKGYLKKEQFQQNLISENQKAQELQTRQQQQREQYVQQQAQNAGNQAVETGFKQGWAEFADSVVASTQFIQPIDPQSDVAKAMPPEQVAAVNQKAQQINTGVGKMLAGVATALAVPDTAWVMSDVLTSLGADPAILEKFNNARLEYARNQRDYGELNFHATAGQNGNTQNAPAGLGTLQTNANRAMREMKGYANLALQPLKKLMSDYFEAKAGSYNQNLNGSSGTVRPGVNGNGYDPSTASNGQIPKGPMTRAEIDRIYG